VVRRFTQAYVKNTHIDNVKHTKYEFFWVRVAKLVSVNSRVEVLHFTRYILVKDVELKNINKFHWRTLPSCFFPIVFVLNIMQ